nr:protein vreteno [Aedes albopictus]
METTPSEQSSATGTVVTVPAPTTIQLDDRLDQMTHDYYDPMLNRYDTGPGADLDDDQQPGALAASAAAAAAAASKSGTNLSHSDTPAAVRIRLKNTRDLTEDGLRELCRVYGTVINVHKPKQDSSTAFVEFANQSEAGLAIQELNRKLGFQFYPAFAHEKKTLPPMDMNMPAPPPPFESAAEVQLVQTIEASGDEESWELTLAPRRIKTGFSIPLKVRFPEKSTLATAPFYASRTSPLSRVDVSQLFSVVTVLDSEHRGLKPLIDTPIEDRIENFTKREGVNRVEPKGKLNGKPIFGYSGLPDGKSSLFPDAFCTKCGQRGFFSCSLCGTQYCSKHCQHVDYERHKAQCQPKSSETESSRCSTPSKKGAFQDLDDSCLVREDFPKGSHVVILSVLSPERVYVRSLDKESNKEYLQTLSDIAQAGLTAEKLTALPEPGDICLALYEPLKIYCRVLIVKVTRKNVLCVFIEFGLISVVPLDEVRLLADNDLKLRKVRIHKVHLKGITEEYGHIEKAMTYLNTLIDQPLEMKVQLEVGNLVDGELRTAAGISVNKKINDLITIPICKASENPDSFVDYKTVPHKTLPPNQKLDVMILNRTTIKLDFRVSLIAYDDLPYLQDLQLKLQSYGKKVNRFVEHYTPRLNEICMVRNMDTWYRAVCMESVGDGRPTVYLCDYGCLLMTRLDDIRKIPPSLATEVRTTDARVFGVEEAEKAGVKIDSEFLDIYLEENERMSVETAEEVEFKEFEQALSKEEISMLTVIRVPDLIGFIEDRAHCGESLRPDVGTSRFGK